MIGGIVFCDIWAQLHMYKQNSKVGVTRLLLGSKDTSGGLWVNRCWQRPQQEHVEYVCCADGGEKLASSPNAFWDDVVVVVLSSYGVATGIW